MSKSILFVMNTLGHAGAETALLELLGKLGDSYEIDLYVLMGQGELVTKLPPPVHLLNKRFNDCSVLSGRGRLCMAGTVMRALFRRGTGIRLFPYLWQNLRTMLRRHKVQPDKLLWRVLSDGGMRIGKKYDLAVAFIEGGSAYYVADHVRAEKKAVFIHTDYEKAGYTRELDRNCYLKYDVLFAVAEQVKEKFLGIYPECADRMFLFHNQINRDMIRERSLQEGGFTDDYHGVRILTVGRLIKEKAYPVAIEAMKLLKESGCEARWYVLGEGDERRTLERKIAEHGLKKSFLLIGAVDNPFPYYRQADLYVHATGYEGKSVAIQEAQVLGCAIIASDCMGNREQIIHETDGILCDLDPEAVRDAILKLLGDVRLRNRLKAAAADKKTTYEEDIRLLTEILDGN